MSLNVHNPRAKIEDVAEKAGQVMGGGTGGVVIVHVETNNAEKEATSATVVSTRGWSIHLETRI